MWRVLRGRDFALLWFGGLISLSGNWVLSASLPVYVYDRTGSSIATGAIVITRLAPQVLLGSVAGVFVDRWDRKRTLVIANVLLSLVLLPMAAGAAAGALWLVYLSAFVIALLQQFVTPAEDALLPRLVEEKDLVPANALNALNNNLARLGGPALGALLYATLGLAGSAVVDAASFLVAAAMITLVRADGRPQREAIPEVDAASAWAKTWVEWRAGLRLVRQERVVAVLVLFAALTGFGEGMLSALFVPFVRTVLDAGNEVYGALLSAQAIGGLVGGFVIGHYGRNIRPAALWGWGSLGLALFDSLIFLSPLAVPGPLLPITFMVIVGVPIAGLQAGSATIRQSAVADAFRGRVMGTFLATFALSTAVGAVTAGALGTVLPIVPLLIVDTFAYAVGGVMVLVLLRTRPGQAAQAAEDRERASPARADTA